MYVVFLLHLFYFIQLNVFLLFLPSYEFVLEDMSRFSWIVVKKIITSLSILF